MANLAEGDYADTVPDADAMQANITAQDQQNITNANTFSQRNAAVQQAGGNLIGQGFAQMTGDQTVGDPRVVQARRIQTAMANIIQQANAGADPNEDPLTRQERVATAVSAGMAGISPQIALKANMQAVQLQEAATQQNLIKANTARVNQVTADDQTNLDLKKLKSNYVVYGSIPGKDGLPTFKQIGDPVQLYDDQGNKNPDFNKTLQANIAAAKGQGIQSPQFSTTDEFNNSKLGVAQTRAQAMAAAEEQRAKDKASLAAAAANLPEDTLKYMAGQSALLGMASIKSRGATQQMIDAVTAYKAAHGLNPTDEVMAQAEIQGLRAGERAIGTRAGNTTILQNELTGLAQNVQTTLAQVDRSKIPMINAAIRAGAVGALGSGPEAAYATALTAFTTAHGRLIAGATGVTSDSARDTANQLVTGVQSPEAVKAALNQIVNQEVPVIRGASDASIGIMANRGKYPGINKISTALGYKIDDMIPQSQASTQAKASPASTGWGTAMKVSP